MTKPNFGDFILGTTLRIEVHTSDKKIRQGTGFLITSSEDNSYSKNIWLVSNKHVFFEEKSYLYMYFNRRCEHGKPVSYYVGECLKVFEENDYFEHPCRDIDLACINVTDHIKCASSCKDIHIKPLKTSSLGPIKSGMVTTGTDAFYAGYPSTCYDEATYLPLVIEGKIISYPDINYHRRGQVHGQNQSETIIDSCIIPGLSGSPVFVYDDQCHKYILFGVIVRKMGHILGVVIKQRHVLELLDHATEELAKRHSS